MRYSIALLAALALTVGSALAQQSSSSPQSSQTTPQAQQQPQSYPEGQESNPQYPQSTSPQNQSSFPQTQQQYPSNSYPQSSAVSGQQLPAGTQLSIRTDEDITATPDDAGKTYQAEISQDVMGPNGQVMIPRYSPATLTVQKVNAGTMGAGSMQAALALQSITVNGRQYNVTSNTQTASGDRGIGANKRTAEMTGGGALLGTVLGAVLGGGKGAAIGAIAGAGAGATAQVVTRGHQVKVPAETVLQFKLDQPITLQ